MLFVVLFQGKKLATFDVLIKSLKEEYGDEGSGKKFEVFCKWFLENDPEWSKVADKVWVWNDYPDKWQSKDLGTDLVFRDKEGRIWGVQAKCFAEDHSTTKTELNSFLTDTSRKVVYRRLWMQSNAKMGDNALSTLNGQEKPVTVLSLNDFRNANLEYPSSFSELYKVAPKPKPKPDPHQIEAIDAVVKGLKKHDRGQMIMACGTGKTFTTLWIKEALNAETTLVLLPSLNLLSQTMSEWAWGAKDDFEILNVCSDKSVGKTEDMEPSEAPFPVTSKVSEIRDFLKKSTKKVLFCTYQSSPLIAAVQKDPSITSFDLTIADEAHRCAGKVDAGFATVLDAKQIRSKKRLFTTATPRYFGKSVKDAAKIRDVAMVGMDDESVFGPVVHKLTFGEAINRNLLNDYQVVVVGVDEPSIVEKIKNIDLVSVAPDNQTDARTLASKIALLKATKDYDLKRVISFHSRVNSARDFSDEFTDVLSLIKSSKRPKGSFYSDYVSGQMKTRERIDKIQKLKSLDGFDNGLMCNARCLAEGVDVPSLDGIAFIDPRGSQVEIIQAVGRVIRKDRNAETQKKGTIVIPVFVEEGDDPEASIDASNFKPVWDVLNALKAHDDVLSETLDEYRASLAKDKKYSENQIDKVIFDLPSSIGLEFASALRTIIVEASTSSWEFWFQKLKQYCEDNGDCLVPKGFKTQDGYNLGTWVANQRHHSEKLDIGRKTKLLSIGFLFDPNSYLWLEGFNRLQEYKKVHGHLYVSHKFITDDGYKLGQWCVIQRTNYYSNKRNLSEDREEKLLSIGFSFNVEEAKWCDGFRQLCLYQKINGNCLVPQSFVTNDGYALGKWVVAQRTRKETMSRERSNKLISVGFIFDPQVEKWEIGFQQLILYKEKYGDCNVSSKFVSADKFLLGAWVNNQRRNQDLSSERKNRLLSVGFVFDTLQVKWEEGFNNLKQYKKENGDCLVSDKFKTEDGFNLGKWVGKQRTKKESLTLERVRLLDEIGFVWDVYNHRWEEGFNKLNQYKEENGDCLVPTMFKTKDEYSLGTWVGTQRQRKDKLTSKQIRRLNTLGFVWKVRNTN